MDVTDITVKEDGPKCLSFYTLFVSRNKDWKTSRAKDHHEMLRRQT